jgi:hypothetical protein
MAGERRRALGVVVGGRAAGVGVVVGALAAAAAAAAEQNDARRVPQVRLADALAAERSRI